jgi:hypothetical protein
MVGGLGAEKRIPANDVSRYIGGGERGNRFREDKGRVKGDERNAVRKQIGETISITIHDFIPS